MKDFYINSSKTILRSKFLTVFIRLYSKAITWVVAAAYVGFLIYLGVTDSGINGIGNKTILYRSILVPAVGFVIVSVFRKMVASKRPYELYEFTPVIKKNTVGKSFPSRHVFSIFILAVTFGQISVVAMIVTMVLGTILAVVRVYGGVHFPKDVIAGAAIGILSGVIGYLLLYFIG